MSSRPQPYKPILPEWIWHVGLVVVLSAGLLTAERAQALSAQHADILALIDKADFKQPIAIDSSVEQSSAQGHIYAILDHPIDAFRKHLASKDSWCEIIFLHFNIKSCVLMPDTAEGFQVAIYSGRLYYQPPEDVNRNDYVFSRFEVSDNALSMELHGPDGPFGTRNYRISIAASAHGEQTLVRVGYSVDINWMTRLAQRVYFASAGRHRVGFSHEDDSGELVRGVRGMIERNTMRFYLALEAFMAHPDLRAYPERLKVWHRLTEQYPRQLQELDLDTYLGYKAKERRDQERLQREAGLRLKSSHP